VGEAANAMMKMANAENPTKSTSSRFDTKYEKRDRNREIGHGQITRRS